MDLNNKLIIKVQFNDEIRKMPIHNEDITYDELIIMMERVFKHKLTAEDEITIKYKDEDGDLITISDDSDLAFAIESSNILKLTLAIENNMQEESKINNLSTEEMYNIRKELQLIRDHTNRILDKLVHTNGDTAMNTLGSGRTSVAGGKDFHDAGGKEFDPLSTGNHSQVPTVERTETSQSLGSSSRNEDNVIKVTAETQFEPESHRPESGSTIKNQNPMEFNQTQIQSTMHNTPPTMSYNIGSQSKPVSLGQNMPPNMGGQNMPPNLGGQNMLPNLGAPNLPPNMPSGMGGQGMLPNLGGMNMPLNMNASGMPPNMGGSNMPPNIGGPNMPPSHIGGPTMPPSMLGSGVSKAMESQINSLSSAPSAFTGNVSAPGYANTHSDSSKQPAFMNQPAPGQVPQQRQFYPNQMQPPRMSPGFQGGPMNASMPPSNLQTRPPGAASYFNPQSSTQFNPQMPQQNLNYGQYQSVQK